MTEGRERHELGLGREGGWRAWRCVVGEGEGGENGMVPAMFQRFWSRSFIPERTLGDLNRFVELVGMIVRC